MDAGCSEGMPALSTPRSSRCCRRSRCCYASISRRLERAGSPARPRSARIALASTLAQVAFVGGGLVMRKAPPAVWRALVDVPRFVLRRLAGLTRSLLRSGAASWERTQRDAAPASDEAWESESSPSDPDSAFGVVTVTFSGARRWRYLLARLLGAPVAFLVCHVIRLSQKKVGLALVYHSIADRNGDPAFHLVPPHGVEIFRAQMRFARNCFEIVPASELVSAIGQRSRGARFPLAVTFDDDLISHCRAAAILDELGMTGTFFLTGATLEAPRGFWWQLLQACYDRGLGVPAAAIAGMKGGGLHAAALTIQHMPSGKREDTCARLRDLLNGGEPEPGLRTDDIRTLLAARAEIGFHTLHHDYLPNTPDDALDAAVSEGQERLEAASGKAIRTIAYPHGGADQRVAAAARRAGFVYGFVGQPAAIKLEDDPLLLC